MLFYGFVILLLCASFVVDRQKTIQALKIALRKFKSILPHFGVMLILVSISLYFMPESVIREYLGGQETFRGLGLALTAGSIAFMPGFIAFPLCGILHEQGVPYLILSGFSTTLMMVGIVSFPVEKKYLGARLGILRNLAGLVVAVVVAVVTGILYGELQI